MRTLLTHNKVALEKDYSEIWQAGKSVGHIHAIEPAGEIVKRFSLAFRNTFAQV